MDGNLFLDADNHYYEVEDCCTRYIESEFRDRTVHVVESDGGAEFYIGQARCKWLAGMNPARSVPPPGALHAFFSGEARPEEIEFTPVDPRQQPEFQNREARLKVMEDQGLESIVILPSAGVGFEQELRQDRPALNATLTAFNRWLEDDWGYGADRQIYAVPMLSLEDINWATAELERVLGCGARFVHLTCGPFDNKSPAHPDFDPFWARVSEARVPVIFHIGNDGFTELYAAAWGEVFRPPILQYSPFQMLIAHGDRPIEDTIAALILHNLFGRFPDLRVMSIENGSGWVPGLLHDMDKAISKGRNGPHIGGKLQAMPSEIFREHVWVAPYAEDDIVGLAGLIGSGHVLFGSDYPHPEGLAEPAEFADLLTTLPAGDIADIMGDNLRGLVAGAVV